MGCISAGLSIGMATLFTTEYTGKVGFFIWICLIYFFFCGIWAVVPATLAKMYGSSNMAINYGFIEIAVVSKVMLMLYILKTKSNLTLFSSEYIYTHPDFKHIKYCNESKTCLNTIHEKRVTQINSHLS